MKKPGILFLWIVLLCAPGVVKAQGDGQPFRVEVDVESAFVRAAPSLQAEPVASVFDNERLDVVGRNLDGTWFEVRRPGRLTNLGWLFNEMVEWEFLPETLPLTDLATGVEGPAPLAADPGFAVHVIEGAVMRGRPFFQGERIITVPPGVTVPLLERNQDGSWLRVNYLGYDGWMIGFVTRSLPGLLAVPEAPGLPPLQTVETVIIPPEVQLAQVQRLREFVAVRRDLAAGMADFWWAVYRGEIMPCNPPAFVSEYTYAPQDVLELPELRRHVPRLNEGVAYLNDAMAPLQNCGVIDPEAVNGARNDAINARLIFEVALDALDDLEADVIR